MENFYPFEAWQIRLINLKEKHRIALGILAAVLFRVRQALLLLHGGFAFSAKWRFFNAGAHAFSFSIWVSKSAARSSILINASRAFM